MDEKFHRDSYIPLLIWLKIYFRNPVRLLYSVFSGQELAEKVHKLVLGILN